jgi:predicted enzyme related to lactoylglutathione lyase
MSKLVHFEIETKNPAQTMKFYAELFGWTFEQFMEGYWIIRTGEEGAMSGAIMASSEEQVRTVNIISVNDIEAFVAKVPEAGGKVTSEMMDIPSVGRFAYCSDPQGVTFGVLQEA